MACPSWSVVTSRAIAWVIRVTLPVWRAGSSSTGGAEKFECVVQPRLHCAQWWQGARPLCCSVRIERRDGMTGMPMSSAPLLMNFS